MKNIIALFFFLSLSPLLLSQANEDHQWKQVELNNDKKIWFDVAAIDTAKGEKFDVWVLELHKPPLRFDGFEEDVYRSKVLYSLNLNTVKYGYVKTIYYSVTNKELYSYDYELYNASDELRYPYPILEGTVVHQIVKEFFRVRGHTLE